MNREAMVDRLAQTHIGATNSIDGVVSLSLGDGRLSVDVILSMPVGMVGLDTLGDYVKDYGRMTYGIDSDLSTFFKKTYGNLQGHSLSSWVVAENKIVGFKTRATYRTGTNESLDAFELLERYDRVFGDIVKVVGPRADLTMNISQHI